MNSSILSELRKKIQSCTACPRLCQHRENVTGPSQPKSWRNTFYWSKPVPGFGDEKAKIFIVGLAPGLHGANRTGRPFTGDGAGNFLYRALYDMGWSSQPESLHMGDGLTLKQVYISNVVKCAPPGNVPQKKEIDQCRFFLEEEFRLLKDVQIILALGLVSHNAIGRFLKQRGKIRTLREIPFSHGAVHPIPSERWYLVDSYHPSTYNVNTGVLTYTDFLGVFRKIQQLLI